jgi:hypothetical protein
MEYKKADETVGKAVQLVSFSKAIEALKDGRMVQRQGWNGKGLFIFMQVPSQVDFSLVPKMTSLPDSVKKEFERRWIENEGNQYIQYKNQLAMVYPDNTIYGWVASPSDVLEEDWIILN